MAVVMFIKNPKRRTITTTTLVLTKTEMMAVEMVMVVTILRKDRQVMNNKSSSHNARTLTTV
jgi:hypothetical protein